MSKPTAVILGASADRRKYGNKAVRAHRQQGFTVYPVNPKGGTIEGMRVYRSLRDVPADRPDRISVYLPPNVGFDLLEEIRDANAAQVWFNPGSEDERLIEQARRLGINAVVGCSIVDLGVSPTDFPG